MAGYALVGRDAEVPTVAVRVGKEHAVDDRRVAGGLVQAPAGVVEDLVPEAVVQIGPGAVAGARRLGLELLVDQDAT